MRKKFKPLFEPIHLDVSFAAGAYSGCDRYFSLLVPSSVFTSNNVCSMPIATFDTSTPFMLSMKDGLELDFGSLPIPCENLFENNYQ